MFSYDKFHVMSQVGGVSVPALGEEEDDADDGGSGPPPPSTDDPVPGVPWNPNPFSAYRYKEFPGSCIGVVTENFERTFGNNSATSGYTSPDYPNLGPNENLPIYRYCDRAVVLGNTTDPLFHAFQEFEIPFFYDASLPDNYMYVEFKTANLSGTYEYTGYSNAQKRYVTLPYDNGTSGAGLSEPYEYLACNVAQGIFRFGPGDGKYDLIRIPINRNDPVLFEGLNRIRIVRHVRNWKTIGRLAIMSFKTILPTWLTFMEYDIPGFNTIGVGMQKLKLGRDYRQGDQLWSNTHNIVFNPGSTVPVQLPEVAKPLINTTLMICGDGACVVKRNKDDNIEESYTSQDGLEYHVSYAPRSKSSVEPDFQNVADTQRLEFRNDGNIYFSSNFVTRFVNLNFYNTVTARPYSRNAEGQSPSDSLQLSLFQHGADVPRTFPYT